jgi:hypothetical protein
MSISRRQFILGTGAGLILPSYYEKVFSFFENRGEPLIETPKRASRDLYAVDWDCEIFELYLDELQPEPPGPMTIREYAKRYFGDEQGYLDAYRCERDGIEVDFDAILDAEMVENTWLRQDSPMARAYRLLDSLDLGPDFASGDSVGQIQFLNCPNPGSNYLGAQTEDAVSISLLQKRLNELNTGIRVTLVGGW